LFATISSYPVDDHNCWYSKTKDKTEDSHQFTFPINLVFIRKSQYDVEAFSRWNMNSRDATVAMQLEHIIMQRLGICAACAFNKHYRLRNTSYAYRYSSCVHVGTNWQTVKWQTRYTRRCAECFFIKSGLASVLFQAESLLQWKQFHTAKW